MAIGEILLSPDAVIVQYGLWAILCLMGTNALILFPPSEFVCGVAGILASSGAFSLECAITVGALSNTISTTILYAVARWKGRPVLLDYLQRTEKHFILRKLGYTRAHLNYLDSIFARYGELIVLVGRNLPAIRSHISIPAGLANMPFLRFFVFTLFGISTWVSLWTMFGFFFGHWVIENTFSVKAYFVIVCSLAVALVLAISRWGSRHGKG